MHPSDVSQFWQAQEFPSWLKGKFIKAPLNKNLRRMVNMRQKFEMFASPLSSSQSLSLWTLQILSFRLQNGENETKGLP
jgi:hypothetical protein